MVTLWQLLSLKDMGGRRRFMDRRGYSPESYLSEKRNNSDRRSGFDRRCMLGCTVRITFERRGLFKILSF
jgi:hypothetical protein